MSMPGRDQNISAFAFMQRESFLIALLCMAGAVTGLGYVILPGYQFLIVLLLCVIFLTGALKPEYTFYLLLFIIVEEMVQFFVTYTPVYQVRIYPYTVPLVATAIGFLIANWAVPTMPNRPRPNPATIRSRPPA